MVDELVMSRILYYLCVFALLASACTRPSPPASAPDSARDCIEKYDPLKDYFPDKASVEYAQNFSVEYRGSYKVVTVRRPREGGHDEKYVLVQCGAPQPQLDGDLSGSQVVSIPIRSMFSASSTHMPLLVDLGHVEVLSGIDAERFVTAEPVLQWIRQGHVTEFAPNNVTDTELAISKAPEILMSSGGYPSAYDILRRAGIAVVNNAEWQEASALGRAEWVKYMALYLNEEAKAGRLFNDIRDRYLVLRERTRSIPLSGRPRVMTGVVNRGMFEVAGGRSYVATMIEDAGGIYVWKDNDSSAFVSVNIESQIARASSADFWINGGDWSSMKSMLAEERRYKEFWAFQKGNVWLYNRIVNSRGGNDYWSRGTTRPDLILADLIKIFHPGLAQDHEFVWYKPVPAE